MRAFRPSSQSNEIDDEDISQKQANIEKYTKKAQKGAPLFGNEPEHGEEEIV
jgi:hypothetical protein